MGDLYKLGQSTVGNIENVSQEIRLDVHLTDDPFKNTGIVFGTVTDSNAAPIKGALIKLMDENHNPLYHCLTDDKGKYTLANIPPGSKYHFYATKDGYFLTEKPGFSIVAGQSIQIDAKLTIDPNAVLSTIAGHVFNTDGKPLESLIVTLLKVDKTTSTVIGVTTTNEYGQYVFINIPLGGYIVRISGQGYITTEITVDISIPKSILKLDTTLQISPISSQGTVNGVITNAEGNPVVGAVVILYVVTGDPKNPVLTPIRYTRTIDGGVYLFGDVPKGNYIVKANKEN